MQLPGAIAALLLLARDVPDQDIHPMQNNYDVQAEPELREYGLRSHH